MENVEKVSIIVPLYNRVDTIGRCIDSILKQSYSEFECILVDDGSTDDSLSVCEDYAARDDRIILVHKNNGGVSSARNVGLDYASGDWILFVDSDDSVLPNHLNNYLLSINDSVDIVFGGYTSEGHLKLNHSYSSGLYVGKSDIKFFICNSDVISHMPICDRMYRRSIIEEHKIRFNENLPISEDRLFSYMFLMHVNGIATVSGTTYVIDTSDTSSLSQRCLSETICRKRFEYLADATKQLLDTYSISGDDIYVFWIYIWGLFVAVINSMYSVNKNIVFAKNMQVKYFENKMEVWISCVLQQSPKINGYMHSPDNQVILEKKFFRYNLNILWKFFVSKCSCLYMRFIKCLSIKVL